MSIAPFIKQLIAAGVDPAEAGSLAAQIYAAGVAAASVRSPGAERQRRYRERKSGVTERNKASQSDANAEASLIVTNRNKASQSDAGHILYREEESKKDSMRASPKASRGTRIDGSWTPTEQDKQLAKQEGFLDHEIQREASRFRDYWIAKSGSGGVKLDWSATWRNWVRNSAEKLGKKPRQEQAGGKPTENWDAMLKYYTGGKPGLRCASWMWAGPEPGYPGCHVPPEIQRKHGFEPAEERAA